MYAPASVFLGTIEQEFTLISPMLSINDGDGNLILRIKGPSFPKIRSCCGKALEFKILESNGVNQIGKIDKTRSYRPGKSVYLDADDLGVDFPMDLVMNR